MLFIQLVAAATAVAAPHSPEAKAFVISFHKAVDCATNAATGSSFDRDQLDGIPQEALEHCSAEEESAVRDMMRGMPGADPKIVRHNVAAKMRIAAEERLINRVEMGESVRVSGKGDYGLVKAGGRYISCTHLAINRRLEGIYLGDDWTSEINSLSENQLEGYFIRIGRSVCPASFKNYSTMLNNIPSGADRQMKSVLEAKLSIQKVEQIAVAPYVHMALDVRQNKP